MPPKTADKYSDKALGIEEEPVDSTGGFNFAHEAFTEKVQMVTRTRGDDGSSTTLRLQVDPAIVKRASDFIAKFVNQKHGPIPYKTVQDLVRDCLYKGLEVMEKKYTDEMIDNFWDLQAEFERAAQLAESLESMRKNIVTASKQMDTMLQVRDWKGLLAPLKHWVKILKDAEGRELEEAYARMYARALSKDPVVRKAVAALEKRGLEDHPAVYQMLEWIRYYEYEYQEDE